MEDLVALIDSRMMTISMLVRRSSTAVGEEGLMRWPYNDLQSVVRIGGRSCKRWRLNLGSN